MGLDAKRLGKNMVLGSLLTAASVGSLYLQSLRVAKSAEKIQKIFSDGVWRGVPYAIGFGALAAFVPTSAPMDESGTTLKQGMDRAGDIVCTPRYFLAAVVVLPIATFIGQYFQQNWFLRPVDLFRANCARIPMGITTIWVILLKCSFEPSSNGPDADDLGF